MGVGDGSCGPRAEAALLRSAQEVGGYPAAASDFLFLLLVSLGRLYFLKLSSISSTTSLSTGIRDLTVVLGAVP